MVKSYIEPWYVELLCSPVLHVLQEILRDRALFEHLFREIMASSSIIEHELVAPRLDTARVQRLVNLEFEVNDSTIGVNLHANNLNKKVFGIIAPAHPLEIISNEEHLEELTPCSLQKKVDERFPLFIFQKVQRHPKIIPRHG